MKATVISGALLLACTFSALAQSSPITVNNNNNCSFLVELVNEQDDCNASCTTTVVCIPQYTSVTINPCNPDWYWDRAIVTPVRDDCDMCGSAAVSVRSPEPTNCQGLTNPGSGTHCAGCGTFSVDFNSPTNLDIN